MAGRFAIIINFKMLVEESAIIAVGESKKDYGDNKNDCKHEYLNQLEKLICTIQALFENEICKKKVDPIIGIFHLSVYNLGVHVKYLCK